MSGCGSMVGLLVLGAVVVSGVRCVVVIVCGGDSAWWCHCMEVSECGGVTVWWCQCMVCDGGSVSCVMVSVYGV